MATSSKKAIPNPSLIYLGNSSSSDDDEECSIVCIEPRVTNKSKKCVRFNLEPQDCTPKSIVRTRPPVSTPVPASSTGSASAKENKHKAAISLRSAHEHVVPKVSSPCEGSKIQTARKSTGKTLSNFIHLQKLKQNLKKFELKVSKMNVAIPSSAEMPPSLAVKRKEHDTSGSEFERLPERKRIKVSEKRPSPRIAQLSTKRVQDASSDTEKDKGMLQKHILSKNNVHPERLAAHTAKSKSKDILQKYLLYKQSLEPAQGVKSGNKPNESLAKSSSANKRNSTLAREHVRNKLQGSTKHDTESRTGGFCAVAGQSSKQAGEPHLTQSVSRSETTGCNSNQQSKSKSFMETVQNTKQLSESSTLGGRRSHTEPVQTSRRLGKPCTKSTEQQTVKSSLQPQIKSSNSKLETFIYKGLNRNVKPSSLLRQIHGRTASRDGSEVSKHPPVQRGSDGYRSDARGRLGRKNGARRSVFHTAGKQSVKPDASHSGSVAPSALSNKQPIRILSFVDAVSFSSSCDSSLDELDTFPAGSPKASALGQTSEQNECTDKKAEIHRKKIVQPSSSAHLQNHMLDSGGSQSLVGLGSSANATLGSAADSQNSKLDSGACSQNSKLDSGADSQNSKLDSGAHSQNFTLDSGARSQNSTSVSGAHSQNSMSASGAHSQNSMLLDQDSGAQSHNFTSDSEYEKKLQETIAKVIASSRTERGEGPLTISIPLRGVDHVDVSTADQPPSSTAVSSTLPPSSKLTLPNGQPSASSAVSSNQATSVKDGILVDKEVLDSYLEVRVQEAVYSLKDKLKAAEKLVTDVLEEKQRLQNLVVEKILQIRELTKTTIKPLMVDKDCNTYQELRISSPVSSSTASTQTKAKKKKSVRTQTEKRYFRKLPTFNHACVALPYDIDLCVSDEEGEQKGGVVAPPSKYLRVSADGCCSRCVSVCPRWRLRRDLLLMKTARALDSQMEADQHTSILGCKLTHLFNLLAKQCHFLRHLPTEPLFIHCILHLLKMLDELLDYLPKPTRAVSARMEERYWKVGVSSWVLGTVVKELCNLLQSICKEESRLPVFLFKKFTALLHITRGVLYHLTHCARHSNVSYIHGCPVFNSAKWQDSDEEDTDYEFSDTSGDEDNTSLTSARTRPVIAHVLPKPKPHGKEFVSVSSLIPSTDDAGMRDLSRSFTKDARAFLSGAKRTSAQRQAPSSTSTPHRSQMFVQTSLPRIEASRSAPVRITLNPSNSTSSTIPASCSSVSINSHSTAITSSDSIPILCKNPTSSTVALSHSSYSTAHLTVPQSSPSTTGTHSNSSPLHSHSISSVFPHLFHPVSSTALHSCSSAHFNSTASPTCSSLPSIVSHSKPVSSTAPQISKPLPIQSSGVPHDKLPLELVPASPTSSTSSPFSPLPSPSSTPSSSKPVPMTTTPCSTLVSMTSPVSSTPSGVVKPHTKPTASLSVSGARLVHCSVRKPDASAGQQHTGAVVQKTQALSREGTGTSESPQVPGQRSQQRMGGTTTATVISTDSSEKLPSLPNVPPPVPAPVPLLTATASSAGIILRWTFSNSHLHFQQLVQLYELYAHVGDDLPPVSQWCKVDDIVSLPLPMAVTLANFSKGTWYHFSIRAVYKNMKSDFSKPYKLMA